MSDHGCFFAHRCSKRQATRWNALPMLPCPRATHHCRHLLWYSVGSIVPGAPVSWG